MAIIHQARQTGKSYDIAQLMKKDRKSICIQPNQVMKRYFCKRFRFTKKRVMSILEYSNGGSIKIKPNTKIYIDEIDLCMMNFFVAREHEFIYGTYT